MNRRCFLGLSGLLASAPHAARSESVFQQMFVRSSKTLSIGYCSDDSLAGQVGSEIVNVLNNELPVSHARLSKVNTGSLASQLGQSNVQTALLNPNTVQDIAERKNGYEDLNAIDLYTLAMSGGCALVCRSNFPDRQAWQLANALKGISESMPKLISVAMPPHPGSVAMLSGRRIPA